MSNLDRDTTLVGCIPAEAPSAIAKSTLDLLLKLDYYAELGLSRAAFHEYFIHQVLSLRDNHDAPSDGPT